MCTDLHFHLLFPPGKPTAALLRGCLCMWQVSLGPQQVGWFLPSSFWVSLLPPSCLITGQGARPVGWETGTEKWKIKTRPDCGPLSELPLEKPGVDGGTRQARHLPSGPAYPSSALGRFWNLRLVTPVVWAGVPLHLDELRGRGLKQSPGSRVQER